MNTKQALYQLNYITARLVYFFDQPYIAALPDAQILLPLVIGKLIIAVSFEDLSLA